MFAHRSLRVYQACHCMCMCPLFKPPGQRSLHVSSESSALSQISHRPEGARTHSDYWTLYLCVCVSQSVKPPGQRSPPVSSESTALSHSQCLPRTNRVNRACFRVRVCVRNSSLLDSGVFTCHPSHQRLALHNDQPPPVGWTVSLLSLPPRARHQREQEPGAKLSRF